MNNKKLAFNAIVNAINSVFKIAFPLITFSYVSRVLHVNNTGIYNYSNSIAGYFVLVAGLGIEAYAVREGSAYRNDLKRISEFASEIFTVNIVTAIISYMLLFLLLYYAETLHDYRQYILILSSQIVFGTCGCEWIYEVYENFSYLALRNIVIRMLSLIFIFCFVRSEEDLLNYVIINAAITSVPGIVDTIYRRKYCHIGIVLDKQIFSHFVPIIMLFASSITIILYISSDIIILGLISGEYYVGIYSISSKIYRAVKTVLSAVLMASTARLSALLRNDDNSGYSKTARKVLDALFTFITPAVIGLASVAGGIVYLISGPEYSQAATSLQILSLSIIFSLFGWFYNLCVLVPNRQEKKVLLGTVIAASVNVVLDFMLIPGGQQNAAAFTTLLAEIISAGIGFAYGRKYYKHSLSHANISSVLVGSSLIIFVCYIISNYVDSIIISTVLSIISSTVIYAAILILMKNSTVEDILKLLQKK